MKKSFLFVTILIILLSAVNLVSAQTGIGGDPKGEGEHPDQSNSSSISLKGNTLYAVTFASAYSTNLYTINSEDGATTYIGNVGIGYVTDLEFYGNELYAITFDEFLKINTETGQGEIIGPFGFGYGDMNSLAVSPDGTAYAASLSGDLISINRNTGEGSYIGSFGPGLYSSGDMAFNQDRVLYGSLGRTGYSTDWLAIIDLNSGTANLVGSSSIGYDGVWGLTFKDGNLYGVTKDGELLLINSSTGVGTVIADHSLVWAGMTVSPACLDIVDGICIATDLDHTYLAKIDLANPNIRVELAHDFADPSTGLFNQKKVLEFVESDSGAGNDGDISRYFVAINGTAKSTPEFGATAYSAASILGINGTTYGFQCVGSSECIDKPNAGFYPFNYQSPLIGIHRAGVDFPGGGGEEAKNYIQSYIDSSIFTVGYQSTILDTIVPNGTRIPGFPAYVASDFDHAQTNEKTALAISLDGTQLFLVAVDNTISTQQLAQLLMEWGAARAIMLDSSWSTQFASYGQDGIDRNYEAKRGWFFTRNVVNSIVVYNSEVSAETQIEIPGAGEYELSPNISMLVNSNTFTGPVNLFYNPQFPNLDDQLRHVNRFFELYAENDAGDLIQPDEPYQLTIYYQEATMPIDVHEEDLGLYYWDGSTWVLEPTSQVNTVLNLITATPSHFSEWAVLGEAFYTVNLPIVTR